LKSFRFSGRAAVVCALILAIGIPATAAGFGEGRNLLLGKRNPSTSGARALNAETEIIADTSTYGTRQSNKKDGDGGGAIYGCRSTPGTEPCIRSNNLKGGRAFELVTVGNEAGRIETGSPTGAPFTTNATGVATGLNADKVDGKDAADFAPAADVTALSAALLDAQVSATGALSANSRGATASTKGTGNTYTVTFNRDVSKCSHTASAVGSPADNSPGIAATPNEPTKLTVDWGATSTPFHVQIIC
jgi:hypothetical protein